MGRIGRTFDVQFKIKVCQAIEAGSALLGVAPIYGDIKPGSFANELQNP